MGTLASKVEGQGLKEDRRTEISFFEKNDEVRTQLKNSESQVEDVGKVR